MQVTETLNEGLKRGYAIQITAAELDAKVVEKLKEAQPEVAMKGFRKGKVPMSLLRKQFGPRILGEAMQESIDGAMSKHFEETCDRPALQPEVKMTNEDWKEGDDVQVEMNYEALPVVPEVDLSKVKLERLVVKAEDKDVDEALENLLNRTGFPAGTGSWLTEEGILRLQRIVRRVPAADHVVDYARDIARISRPNDPDAPGFVKEMVAWGAGPRAGIYLILAAKARAILHGRFHATTEDVRAVALPVLRHRVLTTCNTESGGVTRDDVVKMLVDQVKPVESFA